MGNRPSAPRNERTRGFSEALCFIGVALLATEGEPAEVGTTFFMMRKSRLQRKPSFCVRYNTLGRCAHGAAERRAQSIALAGNAGLGIAQDAVKHYAIR